MQWCVRLGRFRMNECRNYTWRSKRRRSRRRLVSGDIPASPLHPSLELDHPPPCRCANQACIWIATTSDASSPRWLWQAVARWVFPHWRSSPATLLRLPASLRCIRRACMDSLSCNTSSRIITCLRIVMVTMVAASATTTAEAMPTKPQRRRHSASTSRRLPLQSRLPCNHTCRHWHWMCLPLPWIRRPWTRRRSRSGTASLPHCLRSRRRCRTLQPACLSLRTPRDPPSRALHRSRRSKLRPAKVRATDELWLPVSRANSHEVPSCPSDSRPFYIPTDAFLNHSRSVSLCSDSIRCSAVRMRRVPAGLCMRSSIRSLTQHSVQASVRASDEQRVTPPSASHRTIVASSPATKT